MGKHGIEDQIVECSEMLRKQIRPTHGYIICCVNGARVEDCTEREVFHPGETVIIDANLNFLNRYYNPYYACGYTQLVSLEKKIDLLTHNLLFRTARQKYNTHSILLLLWWKKE